MLVHYDKSAPPPPPSEMFQGLSECYPASLHQASDLGGSAVHYLPCAMQPGNRSHMQYSTKREERGRYLDVRDHKQKMPKRRKQHKIFKASNNATTSIIKATHNMDLGYICGSLLHIPYCCKVRL